MAQNSIYEVFLDGSCSFCRWVQSKVQPFDTRARVRFMDYNDPKVASQAPFPHTALDAEMHVRTPQGTWVKGYTAWVAVLRALPKLAWLGFLGRLPPFRWLGPSLYAFVARHRYSLPGAPARCDTDTCSLPERPVK